MSPRVHCLLPPALVPHGDHTNRNQKFSKFFSVYQAI
jgi:hypothetical protein